MEQEQTGLVRSKSAVFEDLLEAKNYDQVLADPSSIEYEWLLRNIAEGKVELEGFLKDISDKLSHYPTLLKDLAFGIVLSKKRKSTPLSLIKLLAAHGADFKSYTRTSNIPCVKTDITLLHDAIQQGDVDLATYLITEQNVNVGARTSAGETPLDYAESSSRNNLTVIKNLLVSYGAIARDTQTCEIIMSHHEVMFLRSHSPSPGVADLLNVLVSSASNLSIGS